MRKIKILVLCALDIVFYCSDKSLHAVLCDSCKATTFPRHVVMVAGHKARDTTLGLWLCLPSHPSDCVTRGPFIVTQPLTSLRHHNTYNGYLRLYYLNPSAKSEAIHGLGFLECSRANETLVLSQSGRCSLPGAVSASWRLESIALQPAPFQGFPSVQNPETLLAQHHRPQLLYCRSLYTLFYIKKSIH